MYVGRELRYMHKKQCLDEFFYTIFLDTLIFFQYILLFNCTVNVIFPHLTYQITYSHMCSYITVFANLFNMCVTNLIKGFKHLVYKLRLSDNVNTVLSLE